MSIQIGFYSKHGCEETKHSFLLDKAFGNLICACGKITAMRIYDEFGREHLIIYDEEKHKFEIVDVSASKITTNQN